MPDLNKKILNKKAKIAVIGLGYVGLPLAVEFANVGYPVIGVEQNPNRMKKINKGENYISDVSDREVKKLVRSGNLKAVGDFAQLADVDIALICVPTPLDKNHQPDISYIRSVTKQLAKVIHVGQLIILESTTYPGTTEEVVMPMLEASGLKVGKDIHLAFSPERVDPGNKKYSTKNITKVVGGVTPQCTKIASLLYSQIIKKIHTVSSPRVAEMEKLLENVFRSVNIALVNELAILCKKMKIDIWEVIDAAKTKPYGFMPFYPGPGIGGHCIPLDPFYLSWKAKEYGLATKFIELAGEINDNMPEYIVRLVQDGLNQERKSLKDAKILLLGAAYKKDIDDIRESPSLKIIETLLEKGARVEYHDPYVPSLRINGKEINGVKYSCEKLKKSDCVVIATAHSVYDYPGIVKNSRLIVDTRNATNGFENGKTKIIRL